MRQTAGNVVGRSWGPGLRHIREDRRPPIVRLDELVRLAGRSRCSLVSKKLEKIPAE